MNIFFAVITVILLLSMIGERDKDRRFYLSVCFMVSMVLTAFLTVLKY